MIGVSSDFVQPLLALCTNNMDRFVRARSTVCRTWCSWRAVVSLTLFPLNCERPE